MSRFGVLFREMTRQRLRKGDGLQRIVDWVQPLDRFVNSLCFKRPAGNRWLAKTI